MRSLTRELVAGSCLLGALTCFAGCSFNAVAAQDSPEAAVLEEQLRQAARYYEQQRKETDRLQRQIDSKERLARQFQSLIAKAQAQHAKIQQWEKKRSAEMKTLAKSDHRKKRLEMATTFVH
jgi:septal ring factor EnvC (AmiA/AmiB activator)